MKKYIPLKEVKNFIKMKIAIVRHRFKLKIWIKIEILLRKRRKWFFIQINLSLVWTK